MRLSDCLFSLRPSLCPLHCVSLSSTSSSWNLDFYLFLFHVDVQEQDPLCTSPTEESGPLANNAPLTLMVLIGKHIHKNYDF